MTLNSYFALKSVFGLASNGLAYSGFQIKLFGNLQSYAYTFSGKIVAQGTHFLAVYGSCRYSPGFPGEWASNESVVVENGDFRFFYSLSFEHFTYRPHNSFHMMRRSMMTLAIFQGH